MGAAPFLAVFILIATLSTSDAQVWGKKKLLLIVGDSLFKTDVFRLLPKEDSQGGP